jgi:hypothetical protein
VRRRACAGGRSFPSQCNFSVLPPIGSLEAMDVAIQMAIVAGTLQRVGRLLAADQVVRGDDTAAARRRSRSSVV